MNQPWEKQFGESYQAFEAFVVYRDMGVSRSTTKAARQLNKSKTMMDRWSSRWNWTARASAWDNEQDRVKREASLRVMDEMGERHARLAVALLNKVVQRLVGDAANGVESIDANRLGWKDIDRVLETAAKLERLARGAPATTQQTIVTGMDGGPVETREVGDDDQFGTLVEVVKALEEAGIIPEGTSESLRSATEPEADAVHVTEADGEADSVPAL